MNLGARGLGKRAGNDHTGKAPARSEIDPEPSAWGEVEELEGIRDVASPELGDRAGRNEMSGLLPREQELDEAIEPLLCFT
jgi:hypothetical protein